MFFVSYYYYIYQNTYFQDENNHENKNHITSNIIRTLIERKFNFQYFKSFQENYKSTCVNTSFMRFYHYAVLCCAGMILTSVHTNFKHTPASIYSHVFLGDRQKMPHELCSAAEETTGNTCTHVSVVENAQDRDMICAQFHPICNFCYFLNLDSKIFHQAVRLEVLILWEVLYFEE
jgi:hypothetical protein